MSSLDNVGIVGQGFVGTAVKEGIPSFMNTHTYDKYLKDKSSCNSIEELTEKSGIIFLCLPTPMHPDGSCDFSIVKDVVNKIDEFDNSNLIVLKSTVPPGTTESLNRECKNTRVVFNPEFLTEANFIEDFKNQNRIIIGGAHSAVTQIKNFYVKIFRDAIIIKTNSTTAECVKYFTNCFLATKVSFANEFKQICDASGVDYDKVVEYALHDSRIGKTHLSVPGPDGYYGFGGSCFPKDINAIMHFAQANDIVSSVLNGAWEKNIEVRPDRDWENLKGRAVT
tara:strand:+ start:2363 stop:3205 length:843 start_codon:yes stop_codon:yes gene_type:complete